MGTVLSLALNTFREASRDRVLQSLLAVGVGLLLFALALAQLGLNQTVRVMTDVGAAALSVCVLVGALSLSAPLLQREMQRRTLYLVLTKPVRRATFVLGKSLGVQWALLVLVLLLGAVYCLLVAIVSGLPILVALGLLGAWAALTGALVPLQRRYSLSLLIYAGLLFTSAVVVLSLASQAWMTVMLLALLPFGEALLLSGVVVALTTFSTPLLSALIAIGIWVAGRSADLMATTESKVLTPMIRALMRWVAKVVPNFNLFAPRRYQLEDLARSAEGITPYLAEICIYATGYAFLLLIVSVLVFQRRNLV